jgi:hypothetical protein
MSIPLHCVGDASKTEFAANIGTNVGFYMSVGKNCKSVATGSV